MAAGKAIAAELSISRTTAARHVANILVKLGFRIAHPDRRVDGPAGRDH
jgi:DNA-binding NarL/FixJ family response regulator